MTRAISCDGAGNITLLQYPTCAGDGCRFNRTRVSCSNDFCYAEALVLTRGGTYCVWHAKLMTDQLKQTEALLVKRVFGMDVLAQKTAPGVAGTATGPSEM